LRRKKEYANRISKMIEYIHTDTCRSVIIGQYFGDSAIIDCSICDNCTEKIHEKKRAVLIPEMIATILAEIKHEPKSLDYLNSLVNEDERSVMLAISYLKEEHKIKIYQDGKIGLK
jgi:ATP-dependent DNA helicase RecQ